MSQPVTVRLDDPSADELRQIARRERRSVSEVGARFIQEGLLQTRYPLIEFRSFNGERHACVKGRLQVWQVVMVARDYGMAVDSTATHLGLAPRQVEAALAYYGAHPEEIDQALADNDAMTYERVKELLPDVRLFEVPAELATESR